MSAKLAQRAMLAAAAIAAVLGPAIAPLEAGAIAETRPSAAIAQADDGDPLTSGLRAARSGDYPQALESYGEALARSRDRADRAGEAAALLGLGTVRRYQADYAAAREDLTAALALARAGDPSESWRSLEGRALAELGAVAAGEGDDDRALERYAEALSLAETTGDRALEAQVLDREGQTLRRQSQLDRALERHERALALARDLGDRWAESAMLGNLAEVYESQGDYPRAIATNEAALALAQETGNRRAEGRVLSNLSGNYGRLGRFDDAEAFANRALDRQRASGDRAGEAQTLSNLGTVHAARGNYATAAIHHKQALELRRAIGDRFGEARSLGNLGRADEAQGRYDTAIERYEQALALSRELGDRPLEGYALTSLARTSAAQGRYSEALDRYETALELRRAIGDRAGEASTLNNLGGVYLELGQFDRARQHYQQALDLWETLDNRAAQGATLHNLGLVASRQQDWQAALDRYQAALALRRETGDRSGEGKTLDAIGNLWRSMGRPDRALSVLETALTIHRETGNRADEAAALANLGIAYEVAGDGDRALAAYQTAAALFRDLGYPAGERRALANLAALLARRDETALAIALYKRSVALSENIREDLRALSRAEQDAYASTVADTYRALADLLLQSDRVLEAQQVLDLLKRQELEDYLQEDVRGPDNSVPSIDFLPEERELLETFDRQQTNLIAVTAELRELQTIPPGELTEEQRERLVALDARRREATREFANFIRRPEIVELTQQLQQSSRNWAVSPERLRALSDNLRRGEDNLVMLYPLILEDRLELILVSPDAPPLRRTVPVGRVALNEAIRAFRSDLTSATFPNAVRASAQQLYDWLVRPFEAELQAIDPSTVVYAPDGQLRYIPLAALHDGDRWLVERFAVNNITAASLTELNRPAPARELRILAGAFVEGEYRFFVPPDGDFHFEGLPYAGLEVEQLRETVPGTIALIDGDFSKTALLPQIDRYSVLHFATHAAFLPGRPENSFILMGDGSRVTLEEVEREWFLSNVELVVLSACQTGVGGRLGSGEEVLGFGYLMEKAGAQAAIASLWSVSDASTQVLMNTFYERLSQPGVTKAEALQAAQLALIHSADAIADGPNYSHPYHWSSFFLIGNGS